MTAEQINDTGVKNLVIAIYQRAAKDYKTALRYKDKSKAKEIKKFLTSGAYGVSSATGATICREIEKGIDERRLYFSIKAKNDKAP
jgi:hypothetical protein